MSLLLDALKKAAEHKAAKKRGVDDDEQASIESGASDDSLAKLLSKSVDPDQDSHLDETEIDDLTIGQIQGEHDFNDEAELAREDTELTGRGLDQSQTISPPIASETTDSDDTELTGRGLDQTQAKSSSTTSETTDSDDTELTGRGLDQTQAKSSSTTSETTGDDDTELTGRGLDQTQAKSSTIASETTDGDDTEMTGRDFDATGTDAAGTDASENLQFSSQKQGLKDDTELTGSAPEESEDLRFGTRMEVGEDTEMTGAAVSKVFDEDETILLTDEDVGDFMGDDELDQEPPEQPVESQAQNNDDITGSAIADDTIFQDESERGDMGIDSGPTGAAEEEDYSISLFEEDFSVSRADREQGNAVVEDNTAASRKDYSISLFDQDATPSAPGRARSGDSSEDITDPELSLADQTGLRHLTVFDISEHSLTDPDATKSSITQPTSVTTDLEAPSKTITRGDSTSTHTYAPDNYDRTLQRSENRDASNYFTGMKSDAGVILTAEHAKKIFHSKSSSQRLQNLKVYGGLVFAILVVLASLGAFQLDGDIEKIDNSLRPLKRDPMPGLIRNDTDQGFTDVLAAASGSEVDARILELVEDAETDVGIDEVVVEIVVEDPEPTEATDITQTEGSQDESEVGDVSEQQAVVEAEPVVVESEPVVVESAIVIEIGDGDSSIRVTEASSPEKIQISSKTTITEKDQWLREAYAAYQQGDDEVAWAKYNQVLEVDPENRNALLARAAINIQNNNIAAAISDYQLLLLANPKDSLALSSLTAVANISLEQSESQLKLLIRDEPESPYLNFALGNVYGALDRWQEAQGQYFIALGYNPDDPNYAYNLAVSLEHIAKPRVAILYYQRALDNFNKGLATFNRDVVDQRLEMLRQL